MTKKLLLAGVAALTLGGADVAFTSAEAQIYYPRAGGGWSTSGSWGGPGVASWGGPRRAWGGYHRSGFYGHGGFRPAYYGGYRSAGYYPRYYSRYGYPYYRRRSNAGAVAAGLIGGLALGALAASVAQPAYYYPSYYYPATTVATSCWVERRRFYDQWGRLVTQRVQVCG